MGHVRFSIPLGFQSQVKPQDVNLAVLQAILQQFAKFLREKENKLRDFLILRRVGYFKTFVDLIFSSHARIFID